MKKIGRSIHFIISYIPAFLAISLMYSLIWGINKGFDFSDEGYLMMGYTNPIHIQPTGIYQVFLHFFVHFFSPGVIFFRCLRLLLILLSSFFFCYQFISYFSYTSKVKLDISTRIIVYSSILLANLMCYSIFESNLSYNVLTLCIVLYVSGFMFLLFRKQKPSLTVILSLSLLCSIQFTVKFPTAFLFYFLVIAVFALMAILNKTPLLELIQQILIFTVCFVLFIALIIESFQGPFYSYFIDLKTSISLLKDHDPNLLKALYLESFSDSYQQSIYRVKWYIYLFSGLSFIYYFIRPSMTKKVLGIILCILTLIYISMYGNRIIELELYKSGMRYLWRALDAFLPIIFTISLINFPLLFLRSYRTKNIIPIFCFFLLLSLPILCSLGTGNQLTLQCLQYMFAPVALICMLFILQEDTIFKTINILILVATCCLIYFQTKSGFIDHPYRINGKLTELNLKFSNQKLSSLYTDSSTNYFLVRIENNIEQKTTFKNNIPCIDFCKIPGVVYAINGYTPRNAWFSRTVPELNTYFLSSEKERFKTCVLFLPTSYESNQGILDFLASNELDLKKDFYLLDSLPHYLNAYRDYTVNEKVGIWVSKQSLKK